MDFKFKIGDTVNVSKKVLEANGAYLEMDHDALFVVTKQEDIGEPAYNLQNVTTNDKVYVREDKEYNFIDDELILVRGYQAMTI